MTLSRGSKGLRILSLLSKSQFDKKKDAICLGAQSFEHANVLSEKTHFSALGGPEVAISGPDDLHPMY